MFKNISGASGPVGKIKAAGSGAIDALGGMSTSTLALVGGAAAGAGALVKGLTASLEKFQDTARTARDVGASTGLGEENASRWVAVADDFGIAAEDLSKGIGKIGKSIDNSKWEKYGIETHDASGRARDANDILLDTLDVLGKIPDGTARVQAGNDLLGKSWETLAPMIGKTREEYEDYLGSVEDGQVITAEEQKKAEDMRKAQDALGDAFGEIELAVGSLVAGLSPLIEGLAKVITVVGKVVQFATSANEPFDILIDKIVDTGKKAGDSADKIRETLAAKGFKPERIEDAMRRAGLATDGLADAAGNLADEGADAAAAADALRQRTEEETKAAQDGIKAHQDAAKALHEQADAMHAAADANFALTDAQVGFQDKLAGLPKALEDAAGDTLKTQQAYDDLAQSAGKVADSQIRVAEETANAQGKTLTAQRSATRRAARLHRQRERNPRSGRNRYRRPAR
jgi:hypothetical protein